MCSKMFQATQCSICIPIHAQCQEQSITPTVKAVHSLASCLLRSWHSFLAQASFTSVEKLPCRLVRHFFQHLWTFCKANATDEICSPLVNGQRKFLQGRKEKNLKKSLTRPVASFRQKLPPSGKCFAPAASNSRGCDAHTCTPTFVSMLTH